VVLWPFVLATGVYIGFDLGSAMVGVLGSIAQELFFRAALLPALLVVMRPRRALLLHTLAFGVWHGGALLVAPGALAGAVVIIVVSLGAGYAWGWQTMRDRTVLWAMAHHSLLWVAGSFFDLSPPT
jgi:membrane protease YdiL (CAAX protease family)